MGLGVGALGGLSLGLRILGGTMAISQAISAGQQQRSLLNTRLAQEKAMAADRAATRAKKLNEVISQQAVMAGARGLQGGSVFRQISQKSFDTFHEDTDRDRLNLSMQESTIKSEMAASRAQEFGDIFGAVIPGLRGGARDLLDIYGTNAENETDFFEG
jgi:hypothetical protein